jgi:16S rRNA (cytosine1402-N4)-methyltransferase
MGTNDTRHRPVLLAEIISCLRPRPGGVYADLTVGRGYMAEALLQASEPSGRLFALDIDPEAVEAVQQRLAHYGERLTVQHGSYAELGDLASTAGFGGFDGALLDAGGLSREQLMDRRRGFGFAAIGDLDMRLDQTRSGPTARTLVNTMSAAELAKLFRWAGESARPARAIASAIVKARSRSPITTSIELAGIAEEAATAIGARRGSGHPATRVFLGLRLKVNDELATLEKGLCQAVACLRAGGRLAVLSYHGLEHGRVRHVLRDMEHRCTCPPNMPICNCGQKPLLQRLFRRPLSPSPREIEANRSARSAKLNAAIRTSVPMPEAPCVFG